MGFRQATLGVGFALVVGVGGAAANAGGSGAEGPLARTAQNCEATTPASSFSVFVNGPWRAQTTTVQGRAAAAGRIDLDATKIGAQTTDEFDLVAGADIHTAGGTVSGGVRYRDSLSADASFTITGERRRGAPPFDFADEFARLADLSTSVSELPISPGATVRPGPLGRLDLVAPTAAADGRYRFSVSSEQLGAASGIFLSVPRTPAATSVAITITGPTVTAAIQNGWSLSGVDAKRILWNFPQAGSVALNGRSDWQGAILAPRSEVRFGAPRTLYGQLIAGSAVTNNITIYRYPFIACPPQVPVEPLQLDALCVDPAGRLTLRLRNRGSVDRHVAWDDLDSVQSGAFVARAGRDEFFNVDAGDGLDHRIRVLSGTEVLRATGGTLRCAGEITVTQRATGYSPGGAWVSQITGPAGVVADRALGDGESFTASTPGGYVPGSVPIGEIPGGIPYLVTQPEPRGGIASVSQIPITVTDGERAEITVTTAYSDTPPPTPTPQPTPTPTATPTPTLAPAPPPGLSVMPVQPTLPPGAPAPLPGPDLEGSTPGAPAPDLQLTHTITPRRFSAGAMVTVRLRLRNTGAVGAEGTVMREIPQYPALKAQQVARIESLTLRRVGGVNAAARIPPGCTGRRPVRCDLGTVTPGQTLTGLARVRVLIPGQLHSVLYVSSATPESNRTNNASIANLTSVRRPQRVRMRVSAPARGRVGTPFRYRMTVSTDGAREVRGVRVCTPIPSSFTSWRAPGTFRYHGMRCRDYPTLQPGRPRSFTVSAVPAAGGAVTLRGLASPVGTRRIARARTTARISIQACGSAAAWLLC
jgi:choice-of-anchor A domain-containing protein